MMIVGIGLDIVHIARWARNLERIEAQIFTPRELTACADRADRIDALAARFAAKEACLKALHTGIARGALRLIEIVSDPTSAPKMELRDAIAERARAAGVRHAHVSLTHQEGIAAAVVVLEGTMSGRREESWSLETVLAGPW
jgi:holo-[acyl-carrier protein] synthase